MRGRRGGSRWRSRIETVELNVSGERIEKSMRYPIRSVCPTSFGMHPIASFAGGPCLSAVHPVAAQTIHTVAMYTLHDVEQPQSDALHTRNDLAS